MTAHPDPGGLPTGAILTVKAMYELQRTGGRYGLIGEPIDARHGGLPGGGAK